MENKKSRCKKSNAPGVKSGLHLQIQAWYSTGAFSNLETSFWRIFICWTMKILETAAVFMRFFSEYSHFSITEPLKLCNNKIKICRGSQHVADNEDNNNLSLLNIWPTKTTQSMKKSKFLEE